MILEEGIHYEKIIDPVYKYRLLQDVEGWVDFQGKILEKDIHTPYCSLFTSGKIVGKADYAWDGASGPTIDTPSSMHCSLDHDILWQLIEEGYLDKSWYPISNDHLETQGERDGMWSIRAKAWNISVTYLGRPFIKFKKWIFGRT